MPNLNDQLSRRICCRWMFWSGKTLTYNARLDCSLAAWPSPLFYKWSAAPHA
jgi:hypothetical protein